MVVRDKSLIEPEGDTYVLYYPFTIYEMLCKYSSMVLIPCCSMLNVFMFVRFRFKPYQGITKRIGEIMKGKYPGAWPTWGEVPKSQRDLWFAEFKVRTFCFKPSCQGGASCVNVGGI